MASQAFEQKLKVVVEGVDAFSKSLKSMNDDMTGFINKMKQFVSQMNSISTNLNSAGNKIDESLSKAFFGNRKNKRGWGKDSIADFLNSEFKEIKKAITVTNVDATLEASTKKIKDLTKKADTSIANMKKALGSSSKKKSKSLTDSDTVKKLTDMFAETSWIYGINPDAVTKAWDATDSKYTSIIRNQLSKGKTKVANKFLSKVMSDAKKSANDALNLTNESKNDLRKTGVISRLMKSMIGGVDVEDPRAMQEFIDKMQKEPTDVLVKQLAKLNLNKVAKDAQGELKNARIKIDNALNDALFSSEKGSRYKNIAKGLMDQYKDQPFSTQMGNLKFLLEDLNKAKKELSTDQKVMEREVAELSKKKSAFFNKINNYNNSLADPKFKNDRANLNSIANGVKANVFANTKAEMKAYDEALNAASKIVTDAKLRDKQEKLQEKINRELSKAYDKEKDKKSQTPSSNPYIPQLQSQLTDIASSVGLVVPRATLVDSLIGTISTGVENLTSLLSKLVMSITAVAAAFVGIGYAMKSFLTDVILSTEKMRGYNIGLLGMMKTQGAVNDLMAKSLNVTKDLPIAYDQIFASTKAFSMISPLRQMLTDSSKAEGNLEKLYVIVMALSQIEPEWGIQGAIFSLREALSGDLLSLKRRFEIPVNMITTLDGKKITDVKNNPEQMLSGLYDYLSPIYGKDALEATSMQFGSLMAKIQGYWEIFKNNIGEGGIYNVITGDLKKVRDAFGDFASSEDGKAFAKRISDVYISMYESLKNMATGIKGIIDSIFGTNIQGTDSIKLIVGFVEKYAQILRGIAAYLNSPEAKKAFGDLFDSMTDGAGKLYEELKNLVRNISWVLDNIVSAGTTVYSYIKKFSGSIEGIFTKDQQMQGLIIGWIFGFGNVKDLIASTFGLVVNAGQGLSGTLANITQKSLPSLSDKFKALATGSMLSFSIQLGVILAGFASLYVLLKRFDNYSPSGWLANLFGSDEKGKNDTWLRKVDSLKSTLNLVKETSTDKNVQALEINSNDLKNRDSANSWLEKHNNTIRKLESDTKAKLQSIGAIYDDVSLKKFQSGNYPMYDWSRMLEVPSLKETLMNIQDLRNSIEDVSKFGETIDQSKVADEFNKVAKASEESESGILGFFDTVFGGIKDKALEATERAKDLTVSISSMRESLNLLKKENGSVDLLGVTDETIRAGYILEKQFKDILGYQLKITSGKDTRPENKNSKHPSGQALDFSIKDIDIESIYNQDFLNRLAIVAKENKITDIIFENSINSGDKKFKEKILQPMINEANNAIGQELLQVKSNSAASASHIHMNIDGAIKPAKDMASAIGDSIDDLYSVYDGLKASVYTSLGGNIPKFFDPKDIIAKSKIIADQSEKEIKSASSGFYGVITDNRNKFIQSVLQSNAEKLITELNTGDSRFGSAEVEQIMDTYNSKKSTLQGQNLNKWYESAIRTKLYESAGILTTFTGPILNDKTVDDLEMFADYFGVSISNIKTARDNMQKSITDQLADLSTAKDTELVAASNRFKNIMMEQLSKNTYQFFPNIQANLDTMIQKNAINEAKDFVMAYAPITDKTSIVNALNEIAVDIMSGGNIDEAINRLKNFSENLLKITDQVNGKNNIGALVAGGGIGGFLGSVIPNDVTNIGNNIPGVVKYIEALIDVLNKSKDAVGANSAIIKFNAAIELFKKNLTDKSISQLKAMRGEMAGLNREAKGAWFTAMQGRLEMEPQALGDSFALGIGRAVNEWKNFSEIMEQGAYDLVNSMTSAFETGFFDFMTMKIHTLGDMFKQIGVSIRDEIVKIIAKMLALQTMKIVLGVDVNAQGQSSFTGGGLLGGLAKTILPSVFGGGSGGVGANASPKYMGGVLNNIAVNKPAIGTAMALAGGGMIPGVGSVGNGITESLMMGVAGNFGASAVSKAMTGAKLFGKTGTVTKLWNSFAGKGGFLASNPWVLPAAAAISFLTQPGRLFGGTKDKTGAAQQQYANDTEMRTGYVNRRFDDAEKYKMSSKYGTIARFGFDEIGFRTWNSGGGFLGWKGPKEKHAASDSTAFYNSMKQYYQLLNTAAKEHYENTRRIDKLKEKYNLQGLQEEIKIKSNYKSQIDSIYQTALKNNDRETIDKFRDTVYETANEIADLMDQIDAEKMATSMSKRRYENYIYGGNSSFTEMQIGISEKANNMSKLTKNSREWYDAQIEYLTATKELADAAKNQAQDVKRAMNTSSISMLNNRSLAYKGSGYYGYYNATASVNPYLSDLGMTDSQKMEKYGKVSGYDTNYSLVNNPQRVQKRFWFWKYWATIPGETKNGSATITPEQYAAIQKAGGNATTISKILGVGNSSVGDKIWDSVKLTYKKLFSNNIDDVNARINELITHGNNEANVMGLKNEYKYRMANLYTNDTTKNFDNYELMFNQKSQIETTIANKFRGVTNHDNLEGADLELWDSLQELLASTNNDIAGMYESVAEQAENWINSGFVTKDIKNIVNLPLSAMETKFKEVTSLILKQQFKLDAFSSLKDLDKTDALNVLSGIKNMSGIGYTLSGTTKVNTAIGSMYTDMISTVNKTGDPWQAWYDFQIATTKTKITNLESGTEEWYSAQMELLNLQIEQQQHIKDKTQEVNDAWLDMLESIDKTLQMRIAEERNTAKGDTVFIDMRNINNEEAKNIANQIRDLIAKNDPNAATLIEALKKKLLGIMK